MLPSQGKNAAIPLDIEHADFEWLRAYLQREEVKSVPQVRIGMLKLSLVPLGDSHHRVSLACEIFLLLLYASCLQSPSTFCHYENF